MVLNPVGCGVLSFDADPRSAVNAARKASSSGGVLAAVGEYGNVSSNVAMSNAGRQSLGRQVITTEI
jgi:dihydroxyacetone kinase